MRSLAFLKKNIILFIILTGFVFSSLLLSSIVTARPLVQTQKQDDDSGKNTDDELEPGDKAKRKNKKEHSNEKMTGEVVNENINSDENVNDSIKDGGTVQGNESFPEQVNKEQTVEALAEKEFKEHTKVGVKKNIRLTHPAATTIKNVKVSGKIVNTVIWELRIAWGILGLLLISGFLFLLHFLLPFSALHFVARLGTGLLYISVFSLGTLILYRFNTNGILPGSTRYSGTFLFAFTVIISHLFRKRQLPDIHLAGLPVTLVSALGLLWGLLGYTPSALSKVNVSSNYLWSQFFLYMGFGFLASSVSWLLTSGYLGLFAKRLRGIGYGLEPRDWNEYQIQSSSFVFVAYPLLFLSWFFLLIWSIESKGSLWTIFVQQPNQFAGLFCWIMLSGYLFSLRLPRKKGVFEAPDDIVIRTNRLPSFLLLVTAVSSAAIFVGAAKMIKFLLG